jgi:uncharacterized repeat protein (TIGR04052 family)
MILAGLLAGVGGGLNLRQAKAAETQDVTIEFQAKVGDQPFSCANSYPLGIPATPMRLSDFRFYVSDIALIDANGTEVSLTLQQDGQWQFQNVALLDFEDKSGGCVNGTPEMRDRIIGTVPQGNYQGLKLTVGVPFNLNHADATLASSPLNLTSLWWNWQAGYKFVRIDVVPGDRIGLAQPQETNKGPGAHGSGHGNQPSSGQSGGHGGGHGGEANSPGFPIHLGSTGCQSEGNTQSPSNCANPNTVTVSLPNFDPSQNVVVADVAALVANTNLSTNQANTPPGCMSAPEDGDCAGIMAALGLPFNGTSPQSPTFLRAE